MTKEIVVQISNDLLQHIGDLSLWTNLIADYVEDMKYDDKIIQEFPKLPQTRQVQLIQEALEHFGKKFNVSYLSVNEEVKNALGIPRTLTKILYYF